MTALIMMALVADPGAQAQATTWLEWVIANEALVEKAVSAIIPLVLLVVAAIAKLWFSLRDSRAAGKEMGDAIERSEHEEFGDTTKKLVKLRYGNMRPAVQKEIDRIVNHADVKKGG